MNRFCFYTVLAICKNYDDEKTERTQDETNLLDNDSKYGICKKKTI